MPSNCLFVYPAKGPLHDKVLNKPSIDPVRYWILTN